MSEFKRTPSWVHAANIYEVNLRQYTAEGTFKAFSKHLPRLKDMGVQVLWFMPVTPISQKNKKGTLGSYYACSDYTAINPEFGTMDDFKQLVNEAHAMGFKVIIDWVANHTGWDHKWTIEHPEFYIKDPHTNDFQMASGMDDIIELNFYNPDLVQAMINAMKFWVAECDIDGFRCDLAAWVELFFWQKARPEVDSLKELFWLGEFDELESPGYGDVFDASYSWKWMHKTEQFYKQQLPLYELESLLYQYAAIGDNSMRAWFTSNHDENTWNGTEYEKYGDMAKALAVFSITWNGIPLIYSGQEIPLLDKRLAFFDKDPIEWSGSFALHEFYKTMLTLHATNPALRAGDAATVTYKLGSNANDKVLAYLRKNADREVLVILNLSGQNHLLVEINDAVLAGVFQNIFTGQETRLAGSFQANVNAWDFLVFEKQIDRYN